jgi:hypothetical protein
MSGDIALNDNERAATFIGWKPGPCDLSRMLVAEIFGGVEYRCSTCAWVKQVPVHKNSTLVAYGPDFYQHNNTAPDMSKPENYMGALEATGRAYQFKREMAASYAMMGLFYACTIPDYDINAFWYKTGGEAAIAALAALYDAQARDNKETL